GRSVTPRAETKTKKASIGRKSVPLAVIGEREDRCGRRLDEKERRKAIVEQRIMAGMTRSDVERALGKPDRVSGNNAEVRYQYKADKRRGARSVSFDQEGCVKGKRRYRVERVDPGS
ncbi:TPA: outer membrane protein assembly factor BamE domain-containing protein, partial [Pseudomonas aeruginosa]